MDELLFEPGSTVRIDGQTYTVTSAGQTRLRSRSLTNWHRVAAEKKKHPWAQAGTHRGRMRQRRGHTFDRAGRPL